MNFILLILLFQGQFTFLLAPYSTCQSKEFYLLYLSINAYGNSIFNESQS